MKKKAMLILLLLAVASINFATAFAFNKNEEPRADSPGYYGGTTYTGSFLRVGMNDYGALGVKPGNDGFKYPIGNPYESLATGWWGEGWSVFYDDSGAGFSPDDEPWGTLSGMFPTIYSGPTSFGSFHICSMFTNDTILELTFRLLFFSDEKFVVIQSFITNIGLTPIHDLEFKRVCDWDVWRQSGNDFWGKDDIRRPDLKLSVAFKNTSVAPGTVYMGFASCMTPDEWDLNWDNYYERGMPSPVQYYLRADGTSINQTDGCVVYQWLLGTLEPGETVMVPTIYAAGDTLVELEEAVEEAQEWCYWQSHMTRPGPAPVGGVMESAGSVMVSTLMVLSCLAASLTLVIASIRGRHLTKT